MDKGLIVKRTIGCVCAATIVGAIALSQPQMKTVHADDQITQVNETDEAASIRIVNEIREGKRGALYGGYYRTWHDSASTNEKGEVDHTENTMASIPKDVVDLLFVFPSYTADDSGFWSKLKQDYIPGFHKKGRGTAVIQTLGCAYLNGKAGISTQKDKYPDTPEGAADLARDIVQTYVYDRGADGLDIDVERENYIADSDEGRRAAAVFKEIAKLIGKSGKDDSKLLIMDTTLSPKNNQIFLENYASIDLVLHQFYGGQSEKILDERWEEFNQYISSKQFMIGFSFFEEGAVDGNLWYDVSTKDGKDITDTRAARYAAWQPKVGGLKGGLFSYAIDRDGVTHLPSDSLYKKRKNSKETPHLTDAIVTSDYTVSKQLKEILNKDANYDAITEKDFPDAHLRKAIIEQVGSHRGDIERFDRVLALNDPEIKDLTGLNQLRQAKGFALENLPAITELTPETFPEQLKREKGTEGMSLSIKGLTGLKKLDLHGLNLQQLDGIDATSLSALQEVNLSKNAFDFTNGTPERSVLDSFHRFVPQLTFTGQRPEGYIIDQFGEESVTWQADGKEHQLIAEFLTGGQTFRKQNIRNSAAFDEFKAQEVAGQRFIEQDYTFAEFEHDYSKYSVDVTSYRQERSQATTLAATEDAAYLLEFKAPNGELVSTVHVTVGNGATFMSNLAKGAKILHSSGRGEFNKLLNQDYKDVYKEWPLKEGYSVIVDTEKPALVRNWRLYNMSYVDKHYSGYDISKGNLQVLKDEAAYFQLEESAQAAYLQNKDNWKTVDEITEAKEIYEGDLTNVSARIFKFEFLDTREAGKTPGMVELEILGYEAPAASTLVSTIQAANSLDGTSSAVVKIKEAAQRLSEKLQAKLVDFDTLTLDGLALQEQINAYSSVEFIKKEAYESISSYNEVINHLQLDALSKETYDKILEKKQEAATFVGKIDQHIGNEQFDETTPTLIESLNKLTSDIKDLAD